MKAAAFDPSPYAALTGGRLPASESLEGGWAAAHASLPNLSIEWHAIGYSLPGAPSKPRRTILEHIDGRADFGKILAILGPSGTGKTSLLNALAGRMPQSPSGSALEGEILIGADERWLFGGRGQVTVPIDRVDMPAVSAYVEQDDALFALSSVKETLQMVAKLRMPRDSAYQKERVNKVMADLGISHIKDNLVGSDLPGQRGISGGERKRLNIACQLLHQPKLVFADEPTTGLDSFQALSVMEALRGLAEKGHTVICSIHQPRSSIYSLLDQILLLAGGRVAYFGPGGDSCTEYFSKAGCPVPPSFNPADHILDVVSVDQRSSSQLAASQARLARLLQHFAAAQASGASPQVPRSDVLQPHEPVPEPYRQHARGAPWLASFWLLLARTWRELMRDRVAIGIKTVAQLGFTLLFGTVYYQMDMSQKSLQNRTGILFFVAMNQAFASIIGCSQLIPRQLKVVQRERAEKLYGMPPYYFSTLLTQLPIETLPGIFWGTVMYLMTALRPGHDHVLVYLGILCLENLVGIGLGMVISASVTSVEMAPQIAPCFVILFLLFAGYLLNQDSIPRVFHPLKHISFIRYSFQALAVNELRDNKGFNCKDKIYGPLCLQGNDWLRQLGFEDVSIRHCFLCLAAEFVAFNCLALFILIVRKPAFLRIQKRREQA